MFLISSGSCLCTMYWSQMLSGKWRCSWSSADRRCSNFIWVTNYLIAYQSASYIRDLTVIIHPRPNLKIVLVKEALKSMASISWHKQLAPYWALNPAYGLQNLRSFIMKISGNFCCLYFKIGSNISTTYDNFVLQLIGKWQFFYFINLWSLFKIDLKFLAQLCKFTQSPP